MTCDEFEDRLNDLLDLRVQPQADPLLTAHAGDCDDCWSRLAGSRVLLRGLAKLSPPPLARDFSARVVAQVAEPQMPAQSPARFWLACGVLLSSAAAALLAISIVWYARRGGEGLAGRTTETRPAAGGGPARRQRGFAAAVPGKVGTKTGSFAGGGDLLIEAPRLPGHLRDYQGAIDQLAVALPETARQLDQVDQLAPGFRPLRLSLTVVWDTLCRTIPGAHAEEPTQARSRTSYWTLDPMRVA
jgi:hypothetical protein